MLVANSGLGLLAWRQTVTVAFEKRTEKYSDPWVCSQVPQLFDYGINKRNLASFSDALVQSGFEALDPALKGTLRSLISIPLHIRLPPGSPELMRLYL